MNPTEPTPTVRETIEQIAEDLFILGVHHELNDIPTIDVKFDKFVDAILAVFKDVLGETLDKRSAEYKHLKNKLYKEAK